MKELCKKVNSFKLHELAVLIFVGGIVAECGPEGFQKLWCLMRKFLVHYLYGFGHSEEQMQEAYAALLQYAEELEKFFMQGQV